MKIGYANKPGKAKSLTGVGAGAVVTDPRRDHDGTALNPERCTADSSRTRSRPRSDPHRVYASLRPVSAIGYAALDTVITHLGWAPTRMTGTSWGHRKGRECPVPCLL